MVVSAFDLFKIGIGPSSSHTVGPMWAAHRFLRALESAGQLPRTERVLVSLYGSLALTGKGHATDKAIILGLSGETPPETDPDAAEALVARVRAERRIRLLGRHDISFDETSDLLFRRAETMLRHPNGMRFVALGAAGTVLLEEVYYSVGGGFVLSEAEADTPPVANAVPPHPFHSAAELLAIGQRTGLSIAGIVQANEETWRDRARDP